MRKLGLLLGLSLLLFACNYSDKGAAISTNLPSTNLEGKVIEHPNVTISGVIKNGANQTVVLMASQGNAFKEISKTETNDKGQFVLKGAIEEIGLYQLKLDSSRTSNGLIKSVPLTLVPDDEVTIYLNNDDSYGYTAKYEGTEWASSLNGYMNQMSKFVDWQKSITPEQQKDRDALIQMLIEHKSVIDDFVKQEIEKNPTNPANVLLMTNLMPMMGYEYYNEAYITPLKSLQKAFNKAYPNATVTATLTKEIPRIEKEFKSYQLYRIQHIAPEIALPNPKGDTMKLSSLKGKYVLIDFWASWCGPCRRENPNVVAAYKKYHDKGFEIYSVSLDDNKQKWVQAIQQDGLIWNNHVSELKKWNSQVAQEYGINAIPHSILINPEGKIIAENLRGASLLQKLASIYGS